MIICLSASHKKVSLPMLETLVFRDENEVMKALCSESIVRECVLLQTCHRVEIYCVTRESVKGDVINQILRLWSTKVGVSYDILHRIVEVYYGREALSHLFFLTAGLESLVLGEDQILGQVRTAYVNARKNGTTGGIFDKGFMKAINTGRRVRTETRINEGSVSISSVAIDLAAKELGDLESKRTLVVGAGEAGSIAIETLKRRGVKKILIANRTFSRSLDLASKISGKAIKFDQLSEAIAKVDLIIVAVAVNEPILKARQVEKILTKHGLSKSLYIVDISQPRAVEEKVGFLQDVILKNIDDLKKIVEENVRNRQIEAEKAKKLIFEELERFENQLSRILIQPLVSEIYRSMEELRRKEFDRAVRKMAESDERKIAVIDRFSRELVERLLQIPIEQLSKAVINGDNKLIDATEELFRLKNKKGKSYVEV